MLSTGLEKTPESFWKKLICKISPRKILPEANIYGLKQGYSEFELGKMVSNFKRGDTIICIEDHKLYIGKIKGGGITLSGIQYIDVVGNMEWKYRYQTVFGENLERPWKSDYYSDIGYLRMMSENITRGHLRWKNEYDVRFDNMS